MRTISLLLPALATLAQAQLASAPKYVYVLSYEVYTNKSAGFNQYYAKLKEADLRVASGRRRFIDAHPWSNRRIVSLPAQEMSEYDRRPDSASVFQQAFGEDEYRKHDAAYRELLISRTSYICKYRDDLSLNRELYTREGIKATAYSFVSTVPMGEPRFEELWRKALAAFRKLTPDMVITVAQTLAGPGPRYVLARPLKSYAQYETDLTPPQAVEKAFGRAERDIFDRMVSESIATWETFLFDKSNLDTNAK